MRLWTGRQPGMLTYEAFGVRVELDVPDPVLREAVTAMVPPALRSSGPPHPGGRFGLLKAGPGYRVTVENSAGSEHATLDVALGMLESYIQGFISFHAQDRFFIHAGAVSHGGRAIVIPGESFSGKSTLVAALVEAGASYYSDEFAVLDSEGLLHPYPWRLSLRTQEGEPGEMLHARDLGGSEADQTAEVGLLVLTRYRPGATWSPHRLSSARALASLMGMALAADQRPAEVMPALRRALAGAQAVEGERGEAGSTAAALLELLSA